MSTACILYFYVLIRAYNHLIWIYGVWFLDSECASLPSIPVGKWYCKYCQNMFEREKFVAHNANAVAAGRVSGVDPIEQITKRSIRIVNNLASEVSACILCRYCYCLCLVSFLIFSTQAPPKLFEKHDCFVLLIPWLLICCSYVNLVCGA